MPGPAATMSAFARSRSGPTLVGVPPEVWRIAIVVVSGGFMTSLDTSVVNVGLATIGRELRGELSDAQWITSAYLLALGAALPVAGWLGRRVGVGRLWLYSLAGFTIASGLCAGAPGLPGLIGLRIVQGIAGGLLIPAGQTLIGLAAGPERMGRVMSTVGVAVVLGPVMGPVLGALLIAQLSWQWLFLINMPVGVAALGLGLRLVPRGERGTAAPLDLTGLLLVASGLALFTYGVTSVAQRQMLTDLSALVVVCCGLGLLGVFTRRSLQSSNPLLNLRLFQDRTFAAGATAVVLASMVQFGALILLPLYFQALRNQGVVATGLLLMPFGIGIAATMPLGGYLTDRLGGGIVSVAGLALTLMSCLLLVQFGEQSGLLGVEVVLLALGIGLGLSIMPAVTAAYITVPRGLLGDAASQVNIVQRSGAALASAVLVVLLERGLTSSATPNDAFQATFRWLVGAALLALLAAAWLFIEERRRARVRTS